MYFKRHDDSSLGDKKYDFSIDLVNSVIEPVLVWEARGWRNAWGNTIEDGKGFFLNQLNAISFSNKNKRKGSSWYIYSNIAFLVKKDNHTYLLKVCNWGNKDIIEQSDRLALDKILDDVINNLKYDFDFYYQGNYKECTLLDIKNFKEKKIKIN